MDFLAKRSWETCHNGYMKFISREAAIGLVGFFHALPDYHVEYTRYHVLGRERVEQFQKLYEEFIKQNILSKEESFLYFPMFGGLPLDATARYAFHSTKEVDQVLPTISEDRHATYIRADIVTGHFSDLPLLSDQSIDAGIPPDLPCFTVETHMLMGQYFVAFNKYELKELPEDVLGLVKSQLAKA
ncbi:MAG: hypothetical protein HGA85_06445 [Nanoarchaeota archaeon]|nr:hypothetical protein [Nanoarchaeota archaeon]